MRWRFSLEPWNRGLSPDRSTWIPSRSRFLLPVKVLSRVFRGKFLALLRTAFRKGRLQFHGRLTALEQKSRFRALVRQAFGCEWVVYTKPPFGGPEQVLRYLSRYTHRVAISNHVFVRNNSVCHYAAFFSSQYS